jgi:hypothetical protein
LSSPHAQVGLVRPVLVQGLGIGQLRERAFDLPPGHGEKGLHEALVEGEEVRPVDEARFDVDLGELELAIGPEGLVPETADDLEIAVNPGDHEGLFELLRRLGQGVEASLIDAARDEEVPRPLGRGVGQDGCFDLEEAVPAHIVAYGEGRLVPEADVALHPGAPQVEVAVLQAELFGSLGRVGDDERRHLGSRENMDFEGLDLDFARWDVLVDGRPAAYAAAYADDELVAELFGLLLERRAVGLENDLGQAFPIADVDEHEVPHVAGLVHPAAEDDLQAVVFRP